MKLIVTKVREDIINRGCASATVGLFDERGAKQGELEIAGYNFVQRFGDIKEGQELKLIPTEIIKNLASLQV